MSSNEKKIFVEVDEDDEVWVRVNCEVIRTEDIPVFQDMLDGNHYDGSALGLHVRVKRLMFILETIGEELVVEANKNFAALRELAPTAPHFVVDGGKVTSFTPRASYVYPKDIADDEEKLKKRKEEARESGLATKLPKEDSAGNQTYAISVKDCL